ncbi:GNAT family N-acetyltransferase [Psychroserpens ponticola]|uniref:GNAT family N-acetyltransferase n=1 Tax=Psychroserpens ponticola TaxID=2932268 RepID=A0ABY7RYR2_9FLAO|nr:GNAT family N-acetyltransferase [Psychroserpens ponticola]WCO02008.1 GNAT family N-acetyltransferase [Psychroserpens ponticola]
MIVRHLGHTDFNTIMECFLSAFENYFVKMPTDYNYYRQCWKVAKVNFNLSYGMFDNGKLVGFIINAIDERHGEYIAFNTGTGVIPEYRGQKIVKSIYAHAIPGLIQNGITKCTLEVITENHKAIKSYESIGFKICKTYNCFAGELSVDKRQVNVEKIPFEKVLWEQIPNQDMYSWDFHYTSLKHGKSRFYYVYNNTKLESFFAINPDGTINQFEVFNTKIGNWERLLYAIQSILEKVRIINLDDRLESKRIAIENAGLKNTVNQYEMELNL